MRTITISGSSTTAGSYGPIVASSFVGQTVTNMGLKANLAGAAPSANTGNNIGASFSYFSEWNYIKDSAITGWASFGTCYQMNYLYYYTNYNLFLTGTTFAFSYKRMSGVVCPTDITTAGLTTASLTVSNGYLPAKWGKTIPGNGAYSQNTGQLLYINTNFEIIGQNLLISGTVGLPPAGPLLEKSVGEFVIPLQSALDGNSLITITGKPGTTNLPFLSSAAGTCSIFYLNQRMPIGCIHTSSFTRLQYTLSIKEEGLLPAGGNMQIVHYGLSTNSSYNTVLVDIVVSSLIINPIPVANDLIFQKLDVSFAWQVANPSS